MKVLLFTLEYPPYYGGVAKYYGNLVKYWPSQEQVIVLDNKNNRLFYNYIFPQWLPAIWKLYRLVNKEKIEHVIVGQILPLGTVVYLVSLFKKISYSVFLHGMDINNAIKIKRKKFITQKILKRAENIICANNFTAKIVIKDINKEFKEKSFVVHPGIAAPSNIDQKKVLEIKNKYDLTNKIILFSLGRLIKRKGFDKVIAALPEIKKSVPNIIYVMAGDGPEKNDLINRAIALDNVIFLGSVSEEEKWLWYYLCDIFIMPAREINGDFEGFGIVYLEANVMAKPTVASTSGGAREAVEDNVSGLLVNPNNLSDIAQAVIKLAQNSELRKVLGEQGKARALNNFHWANQTKKIYLIINKSQKYDINYYSRL